MKIRAFNWLDQFVFIFSYECMYANTFVKLCLMLLFYNQYMFSNTDMCVSFSLVLENDINTTQAENK